MIPMDAREVWVVVANRSRAKLFRAGKAASSLSLIQDFQNPSGKLQDREIHTDKQGRGFVEAGEGRYAYDAPMSGPEKERQSFGRQLGQYVNTACSQGSFDYLVLIAEARFLGELRQNISKEVEKRIINSFAKDLIPLEEKTQLEQVKDLFEAA